jgi:hypothetical protein
MSDATADDSDELPTVERGERGKVVLPERFEDVTVDYRTRGFGFTVPAESNQTELPYSAHATGEFDIPAGVVEFETDDGTERFRVPDADV